MFLILSFIPTVFASENIIHNDTDSIDSLDVMLTAYRFMSGVAITGDESRGERSICDSTTKVKDFQPLYDNEDNLIAYYVSFQPSGYVIVNNLVAIVIGMSLEKYMSKKKAN